METLKEKTTRQLLRRMFDRTAPRYVRDIDPAFQPLNDGLVRFAAPTASERVLDLGTGTGLVTLAAAPLAASVLGLDFSHDLLKQARSKLDASGVGTASFIQGDMHALCVSDALFDVLLGAFSFHSTDPAASFGEAFRVLVPGGRLIVQEWGEENTVSEVVYDALEAYAIDDPPAPLMAMREAMSAHAPWDELEGVDGLVQAVEEAGFVGASLHVQTEAVRFESAAAFVAYKLAWASRADEVTAMPHEWRELFWAEITEGLDTHRELDGSLIWRPEIIRLRATKPSA